MVLEIVALVGATVAQGVRWLRVLQREHYDPTSMRRFLARWSSPSVGSPQRRTRQRPVTLTHVCLLVLVVALIAHWSMVALVDAIAYGLFCPVGLSLKGRTSSLQWTRRLRLMAGVAGGIMALIAVGASTVGRGWLGGVVIVWSVPLVLDLAARILAPYERRHAQRFVDRAARRLAHVAPVIVGITGSYGKTSTKQHVADLLRSDGGIVATPRSFNNRAGLSRAINEGLVDGTRVFIAEMGTYGPGEIAELVAWCPPSIAVVTAIGPVHLERMGSLDVIEAAKFEITSAATTVVLNVDDERLATWPERLTGRMVRTAGSRRPADVRVQIENDRWLIVSDGAVLTSIAPLASVQPTNLACAIATAQVLGVSTADIVARIAAVQPVANRASVVTAPSGVVVIDDTFNANPASAMASLQLLARLSVTGRRVVVTPGLIELGPDQYRENARLATQVADQDATLVIVQRTNARALLDGYAGEAIRVAHRADAVAWVRQSLKNGDAVLYLNDLPDHYP